MPLPPTVTGDWARGGGGLDSGTVVPATRPARRRWPRRSSSRACRKSTSRATTCLAAFCRAVARPGHPAAADVPRKGVRRLRGSCGESCVRRTARASRLPDRSSRTGIDDRHVWAIRDREPDSDLHQAPSRTDAPAGGAAAAGRMGAAATGPGAVVVSGLAEQFLPAFGSQDLDQVRVHGLLTVPLPRPSRWPEDSWSHCVDQARC